MKKYFSLTRILVNILFIAGIVHAQAPDVLWTQTYGGANYDIGYALRQTSDGGYIITGSTMSNGAGDKDVWLIRTDSLGNVVWSKTFGGTGLDEAYDLCQNSDGGFTVVGQSRSFPADSVDIFLIRVNSSGNTIWQKLYGGPGAQFAHSIQPLSGGGFIIGGGLWTDSLLHSDAFLLHVDSAGNNPLQRTFHRTDYNSAGSVVQTATGDIAFFGQAFDGSVPQSHFWFVKIDASGNIIADKTYGITGVGNNEYPSTLLSTFDGGFAMFGTTYTYGAGGADFYLVRTNSSGDTLWTKTYGGSGTDLARSMSATADSGFLMVGYSKSFGSGAEDIWLVRTNSSGDTLWTKNIPFGIGANAMAAVQTSDGEYAVTGYESEAGMSNVLLMKLGVDPPLPVELNSFSASARGESVELRWSTATETNNYGFEIQKSVVSRQPSGKNNLQLEIDNQQWQTVGFVIGNGTSNSQHNYFYTDNSAGGNVRYRLKQIDNDGKFTYSQEIEVTAESTPAHFALMQNFPNPFNPVTTINYSVGTNARSSNNGNGWASVLTSLKVYDVLGNEVATLVNEAKETGSYSVQFDGSRYSSGIYFYRLTAGSTTITKKFLLQK